MNETTTQTGMSLSTTRAGEMASTAAASRAKAEVEARFVIALQRPRNILDARARILDACRRPAFAAGALYKKPVGSKKVAGEWRQETLEGLSIRFAETAIQAMRNIVSDTSLVWEDETKRSVKVTVTDLESNLTYSKDITVEKTVERRKLKDGQAAISERVNSYGDKVYLVAATEDEIAQKISAQESKIIRNCGLRLIPQDILDEAQSAIRETLSKGGSDPKAEIKKVCDAFRSIGVGPVELVGYLGHSLETVSPSEIADLRAVFSAIRDGEASWADYTKQEPAPADDSNPELNPAPMRATPAEPVKSENSRPSTIPANERLAALMTEEGISFDTFRSWYAETQAVKDADSIASFADIPDREAARILLAKNKLVSQLKGALL